ncbi:hypothetical protein MTR67_039437 [Solanum verrucosum]|uniref:Uncharacterized protein n=1 Tax=Solanum verrucosum TaxID=315347 RepID=A0AAF0ZNL3_SOLVR|nr:hypothetical protein MTR67_039437 [Solanum verrucosum]
MESGVYPTQKRGAEVQTIQGQVGVKVGTGIAMMVGKTEIGNGMTVVEKLDIFGEMGNWASSGHIRRIIEWVGEPDMDHLYEKNKSPNYPRLAGSQGWNRDCDNGWKDRDREWRDRGMNRRDQYGYKVRFVPPHEGQKPKEPRADFENFTPNICLLVEKLDNFGEMGNWASSGPIRRITEWVGMPDVDHLFEKTKDLPTEGPWFDPRFLDHKEWTHVRSIGPVVVHVMENFGWPIHGSPYGPCLNPRAVVGHPGMHHENAEILYGAFFRIRGVTCHFSVLCEKVQSWLLIDPPSRIRVHL